MKSFHIVGCSNEKLWPGGVLHAWNIFGKVLRRLHQSSSITTHGFVLMSNHYHWICSGHLPENSEIFENFHEQVRDEYLNQAFFGNAVFEAVPAVFPLTNPISLQNTLKYIYRNPVEAGMVLRAEEYSYSTLGYHMGKKKPLFFCNDPLKLIFHPTRVLDWINDPSPRPLYFKINYYEHRLIK